MIRLTSSHTGRGAWVLVALFGLVSSCAENPSSDSDTKKAEEDAKVAEVLDSSSQDKCNKRGKFYDNLAASGKCSNDYQLATWACSRKGLGGRLESLSADLHGLGRLDETLDTGGSIHQCGESATELVVIAIARVENDGSSYLEIERHIFDLPTIRFRFSNPTGKYSLDTVVGRCSAVELSIYDTYDGDELRAPRDIVAQLSGTLDRGWCRRSESGQLLFFSDSSCQTSIQEATIAQSEVSVSFYVKTDAAACYGLGAAADHVEEPGSFYVSAEAAI